MMPYSTALRHPQIAQPSYAVPTLGQGLASSFPGFVKMFQELRNLG